MYSVVLLLSKKWRERGQCRTVDRIAHCEGHRACAVACTCLNYFRSRCFGSNANDTRTIASIWIIHDRIWHIFTNLTNFLAPFRESAVSLQKPNFCPSPYMGQDFCRICRKLPRYADVCTGSFLTAGIKRNTWSINRCHDKVCCRFLARVSPSLVIPTSCRQWRRNRCRRWR